MRRASSPSHRVLVALVVLGAALLVAGPAAAQKTEIHFWHAMGGQLGETVNELVRQFNPSQAEYEVKALNKGTYPGGAHLGHRRLPAEEPAAHRAGLRGGHPDHAPVGGHRTPSAS